MRVPGEDHGGGWGVGFWVLGVLGGGGVGGGVGLGGGGELRSPLMRFPFPREDCVPSACRLAESTPQHTQFFPPPLTPAASGSDAFRKRGPLFLSAQCNSRAKVPALLAAKPTPRHFSSIHLCPPIQVYFFRQVDF